MIKPLAEIPKNLNEQRKSYREKICADIQEGIDRNINRFEFVGDYNFKTLAGVAREEARNIAWKIVRQWSIDNPEYKERYKFWMPGPWQVYRDMELIKVSSIKGEKPGERRGFCEIKQDMDSIIRAYADKQIKEHEEKRKNNEPS